jgi:hypothetical protein
MSERHQDLTLNHRLESYVYANAAARTGASGFVSGDVGRIAFQTDTGQYWRLTTTTPAWQIIASPVYATYQGSPTGPTGTANAFPGLMMGLPGTITPSGSGKIILSISASGLNTAGAGTGGQIQLRYGTGTKPANGAAVSGSIAGTLVQFVLPATNSVAVSSTAIITGMVLGTVYWVDVSLNSIGGSGTASLNNAAIMAAEIP